MKGMKKLMQRLKNGIYNMKLVQKLSLLLTAIVVLSLTAVFHFVWKFYSKDMEKTTNALFVQISTSIKTVMDNTVNNLNALAKAPLYSKQLHEELNRNQILSSESIAKMQYSSDIVGTTDNLHHVIALYNRSGNIAYSSAVMSMAYVVRQYYDMWYKVRKRKTAVSALRAFPAAKSSWFVQFHAWSRVSRRWIRSV